MTATFDPQLYKKTTRAQWEDAADAWHRWGPTIEDWLGAATERMLSAAGVTAGSEVLDVAAGAGGQSFAAARRVGDQGGEGIGAADEARHPDIVAPGPNPKLLAALWRMPGAFWRGTG